MSPELEASWAEIERGAEAFERQMTFWFYSTWLALLVCAVFSVLVFWKLCQIQQAVAGKRPVARPAAPTSPKPVERLAESPLRKRVAEPDDPLPDDSRYMPRG